MKEKNYNLKIPNFDSKIKFYFSLLFMSISDFEVLVENFKDEIDVFSDFDFSFSVKDIYTLTKIMENLKWNNDMIDLSDKTILRLFNEEEVINYFNSYNMINSDFNIDDPEDLERLYTYMLLEKVKEKKEIEYGTLYDLFDTFSDEEILNAVANLDYHYKKIFIFYFGMKGDQIFEINSNDHVKNEILIKLYSYMLLKREEADILSIIRNQINKGQLMFTFFDYIRIMCKDNSLTNAFISEMLSKMDYNSQRYIKEVFGEKLQNKAKPKKDKDFKKAIDNLTLIIKINKEYRKKKKAFFEEKKEKKKIFEEEKSNQVKKEKQKENKLESEKEKEQPKQKTVKVNVKIKDSKKQKKSKANKKIKENKKERLKKFLQKNNIDKKSFEKALKLLDPISKEAISLYYGIKVEPLDLQEISNKIGKSLDELLDILENAEKKIILLIETGKINKEKQEAKEVNDKNISSSKLMKYINENNVKTNDLIKVTAMLAPIEKTVMDIYLNKKITSSTEIAKTLNMDIAEVNLLFDSATDKMISALSKEPKEEKKQKEDDDKKDLKEDKKEDKKDKNKSNNYGSLNNFLKRKGITKKEFLDTFKTLDSFSKSVMALYLGLYASPVAIEEIAKKYNRTVDEINRIISFSDGKFNKKKINDKKLNLNSILTKYGVSKDTFVSKLDSLPINKRYMIMDYFGIKSIPKSFSELTVKYGKKPEEIDKIIEQVISGMSNNKKGKKEDDLSNKLDKFLTVNKITKEEFLKSLELLSLEEKRLISMYFGINTREMSIAQIAVSIKSKPLDVKSDLSNILRKINTLCKSKNDLNPNILENIYKVMKHKIISMYKILLQDAGFMLYISSNPIVANILSVVSNFDFDLDKTSKMLRMPKQELISNLNKISTMFDNYTLNMSNNSSKNGFYDEENERKQVGRKY